MEPMRSSDAPASSPADPAQLLADRSWVRALALSLVRDPDRADDITQDAFVRALERPPADVRSPAGWMATVVRNLVRDAARRDRRRDARERVVARPDAVPAADLVERAASQRRVIDAVLRLREPARSVVLLRFFEDLPPRAIARRLGVQPETVRTRLFRALAELRRDLDPHGDGLGAVLLPLLALPAARGDVLLGGLLVTTKKKVAVAALLVLLLLGGGSWLLAGRSRAAEEPTDAPDAARGNAAATEREHVRAPAAPPDAATAAAADPERPEPGAASVDAAVPPAPVRLVARVLRELRRGPVAASEDGAQPEEPLDIDVAGGITLTESDGPMWAPEPWKGDVTVRGRVVDAAGRPLGGALLLRVRLDADGRPVMIGAWPEFEIAGTTDGDGRYELTQEPVGRHMLQADYAQVMRRAGTLALEGAQVLDVHAGEVREGVDFRVPVESARLGRVHVRLVNADGDPVGGEMVQLGRQWGDYAERDGTLDIFGIEPGRHTLRVTASGMKPYRRDVDVLPGARLDVEVRLEYALVGALELRGRVLDDTGAPVPNANVFLGTGMDDSRDGRTDADGRFAFTHLPARMAEGPVGLHVYGDFQSSRYGADHRELVLPVADLSIVIARHREVVLHVVGDDGAPVVQFNLQVDAVRMVDGQEVRETTEGASRWSDDGTATLQLPRGRSIVAIEGRGHVGVEVEIDVPAEDGPFEVVVTLARSAE